MGSEMCIRDSRERRLAANLSQHGLSLKAGLGGQAINRIERGETVTVHPLRAREIAKALDCGVEDIFTDAKGA